MCSCRQCRLGTAVGRAQVTLYMKGGRVPCFPAGLAQQSLGITLVSLGFQRTRSGASGRVPGILKLHWRECRCLATIRPDSIVLHFKILAGNSTWLLCARSLIPPHGGSAAGRQGIEWDLSDQASDHAAFLQPPCGPFQTRDLGEKFIHTSTSPISCL